MLDLDFDGIDGIDECDFDVTGVDSDLLGDISDNAFLDGFDDIGDDEFGIDIDDI